MDIVQSLAYMFSPTWSPKAISHFSQLLAHTFPEKSPDIKNVSQFYPQKLCLSVRVISYIHV